MQADLSFPCKVPLRGVINHMGALSVSVTAKTGTEVFLFFFLQLFRVLDRQFGSVFSYL